ncbi:MAG TPA: CsgG/HfaB family protein [Bryobacteraceae bacterium]|jgi:curli biogenesis system outer membrane secretion channel CsgG|nr:CsgG/HfaB family protein [Bryobacteraceae bacterium]
MRSTILRLCVLFLTVLLPAAGQKKRVAVLDFDYATVRSSVSQIFGKDQDIGKGITDMLVDRLVNDGTYSVIERKQIDKIIAEQNFSNSNRADSASAAKLARVLGVDAMIIGSITQFGNDNSSTKASSGALSSVTGRFGLGGAQRSKSTAVVQITARVIDTSTAEVLASCQGKGEASRTGVGLLGSGGSVYGPAAGASIDMRSSGFQNTILGEATNKAVTIVASELEAKAGNLPTTVMAIEGMVADASDLNGIVINVGSKKGVKVGMVLNVKRVGREIRDPDTDKVIRRVESAIGTLTITDVDQSSAVGRFTGAGKPQIKDVVTNQ